VFGVLVAVSEGARPASLLKEAQVIGALVVSRVTRSEDRVAGVGFGSGIVVLDLCVIA